MSPGHPSVAFLGTGAMGAPMARNIAAAGMEVRAWNRSRGKAEPLADAGVAVMDTPAQAVNGMDVVVTMLADASAVEDVMVSGGALEAMRADATWIQMSTVGMAGNERLAGLAAERGIAFVDAPVIGTRQPAEQGTLSVIAAGPAEARDTCAPIFDAVGGRTSWLGAAGEATRLKLVVNNWLLGLIEDLAETVAFCERIGIDPRTFLDTIDGSPVGAPYARLKGDAMIAGEFPPAFSLKLALKDAQLVLEAAERHGMELPVTRAVAKSFSKAIDLGHGDEDMAATYFASAE